MDNKELKIGLHDFKPLVYRNSNGEWTGFELELWKNIASSLNIKYSFTEEKDFSKLLLDTAKSKYDLSMAGITRTTKRSEDLVMSFLTLDTGLGIAVPVENHFSIKDLVRGIFSKQTMSILLGLIFMAFIYGNIYWFIESGISVSEKYSHGLLESFWWSIVTFSTVGYGDIYPVTVLGKIFSIFAILSGLAFFGLYIGQLSASLTLKKIKSKINSVKDLYGKKIGVKKSTTSIDFVSKQGGKVVEFDNIYNAYNEMAQHKIDGVVADLPQLHHDMKKNGITLVGGVFYRQTYSFILPKGDNSEWLLKKINKEIISLRESGEYDTIYKKYFDN